MKITELLLILCFFASFWCTFSRSCFSSFSMALSSLPSVDAVDMFEVAEAPSFCVVVISVGLLPVCS